MKIQSNFIKKYKEKKRASQLLAKLNDPDLPPKERDALLIELEQSGKDYEGILYHGDVKFDTKFSVKNGTLDRDIPLFDTVYSESLDAFNGVFPTGSIVVGGCIISNDKNKMSTEMVPICPTTEAKSQKYALVTFIYKRGARLRDCFTISTNYYTQNKCTLSQCVGTKIVRHSEVNAENFETEFIDNNEEAYIRFGNAYYRAMRLLDVVELYRGVDLTYDERKQLKMIQDTARIIFNRAIYNLVDTHTELNPQYANSIKRSAYIDVKKLPSKLHFNKWKNAMLALNTVKNMEHTSDEKIIKMLKRDHFL